MTQPPTVRLLDNGAALSINLCLNGVYMDAVVVNMSADQWRALAVQCVRASDHVEKCKEAELAQAEQVAA